MASKRTATNWISSYFESLSDPRHEKNRKHLLSEIIVISICAIVSHAEGPTSIHRWAIAHEPWLKEFLVLANGIPSRDCIRRVLIALKPQAFQQCFNAWVNERIRPEQPGIKQLVAIDGKTCRGSHDRSRELGALHLVSAWASEQGIALGQVAVADKSNEITAIPLVLEQLDLTKAIVTIDALGCQREIVQQIADAKGTYVITVKENQPTLYDTVCELVCEQLETETEELQYRVHETTTHGHGRVDERAYGVLKVPRNWSLKKEWPSIKAVGYATRYTIAADGAETEETRLFILNRQLSAQRFAEAVRGHWAIEAMHWVLDVNFREDEQQTAQQTLVNNLSWLRRFAITLLKQGQKPGESIRGRSQMAGWNTNYLLQVLRGQ